LRLHRGAGILLRDEQLTASLHLLSPHPTRANHEPAGFHRQVAQHGTEGAFGFAEPFQQSVRAAGRARSDCRRSHGRMVRIRRGASKTSGGEGCFNKLKNAQRLATRYDKTADSYLGFIHIVSIRLWTRQSVNASLIDRITRSLLDFMRLTDMFERRGNSLVSVSQAFDTSDNVVRITVNVMLAFS